MIIWIDGTFGVGKSTVAAKIKKKLKDKDIYILDSDYYYNEMLSHNPYLAFGGALPQNNDNFIDYFGKVINEHLNINKTIIIVMAITDLPAKKKLYELYNKFTKLHIILTANFEIIKKRIENDKSRDKEFAISHFEFNNNFLRNHFSDAVWIDTSIKDVNAVANEIVDYINKKSKY